MKKNDSTESTVSRLPKDCCSIQQHEPNIYIYIYIFVTSNVLTHINIIDTNLYMYIYVYLLIYQCQDQMWRLLMALLLQMLMWVQLHISGKYWRHCSSVPPATSSNAQSSQIIGEIHNISGESPQKKPVKVLKTKRGKSLQYKRGKGTGPIQYDHSNIFRQPRLTKEREGEATNRNKKNVLQCSNQ